MTEKFATIEASALDVQQAVEYGTMNEFDGYDNSYLRLQDGNLEFISSIPGESASTYAEFDDEDFLDNVVVYEAGGSEAEALIDIEDFLFYLENAETDGTVEVNFYGEEDDRLASYVEIAGSLTSTVYLPTSSRILEQIPLWLPDSFTEDGNYMPGEKTLETRIDTEVRELQRIVDIKESDKVSVNEYPLVVENGELRLRFEGENSRSSIEGSLQAEVEGPDLANTYQTGMSESVNTLSGRISLRASPGGSPVCMTYESDGVTVRNILGHTGVV